MKRPAPWRTLARTVVLVLFERPADRFVYLQSDLSILFVGAKFLVSILASLWRTCGQRSDGEAAGRMSAYA